MNIPEYSKTIPLHELIASAFAAVGERGITMDASQPFLQDLQTGLLLELQLGSMSHSQAYDLVRTVLAKYTTDQVLTRMIADDLADIFNTAYAAISVPY